MTRGTTWPVLVDTVVVWTQGYTWIEDDGNGQENVVVATDAEDGSLAWVEPIVEEVNATRWFAPMVHDGSILLPDLIDGDLGLTVLDPDDGSELDRYDWGLPLRANQPVVADGTVFVRVSEDQKGRLHAFDASNGTPQWDVPADSPRPNLPRLAVGDDAVLSFDRADRAMVARAVESGEERWRASIDLPMSLVTQRPGSSGRRQSPITGSSPGAASSNSSSGTSAPSPRSTPNRKPHSSRTARRGPRRAIGSRRCSRSSARRNSSGSRKSTSMGRAS